MNPFCVRLSSQGVRDYTFHYFYNEEYSPDAQRILARSHAGLPGAWCNCSGLNLPVSIHRRELPGGVRYHLARFPGTGYQHAAPCPFYGDDYPLSTPAGEKPADDARLRLNIPLSYRMGTGTPTESRQTPRALAWDVSPALSLRGLAWHLFRKARLHQCWDVKLVRYYQASHRLLDSMEGLSLQGRKASEVIFLPAGCDAAQPQSQDNDMALEGLMTRWREDSRLGVVIGEVRSREVVDGRYHALHLEALQTPVYAALKTRGVIAQDSPSWPHDGLLDAERSHLWLAATVRISSKNRPWIEKGVLLRTTVGYVPVDNPRQAKQAQRLFLGERQAFERLPEEAITKTCAFRSLGLFSPFK
jgi:hypothetical protein